MLTIGSSDRSGIERAFDWLIPVISSRPQVIDRLPPSSSGVLLLRAYGSDGSDDNQLLQLAFPILAHVTKCLTGENGLGDALRVIDLLFGDIADAKSDRRRRARHVLQEAVGKIVSGTESIAADTDEFSWIDSLLRVKYARDIAERAIPYLVRHFYLAFMIRDTLHSFLTRFHTHYY